MWSLHTDLWTKNKKIIRQMQHCVQDSVFFILRSFVTQKIFKQSCAFAFIKINDETFYQRATIPKKKKKKLHLMVGG